MRLTLRCFSRTVQPHQSVLQFEEILNQKNNIQDVGAVERLDIAELLFSLEIMGELKQNCGSLITCGLCQGDALEFSLPLMMYLCLSSV